MVTKISAPFSYSYLPTTTYSLACKPLWIDMPNELQVSEVYLKFVIY